MLRGVYDNRLDGLITFIQFIITDVLIDRMFSGKDKEVLPENWLKYYLWIPTFLLVVLMAGFNRSVIDTVIWANDHIEYYAILLVVLGVSEPIGGIVDSGVALVSYYRKCGRQRLSTEQKIKLIKYGDYNSVVAGKGVYDWNAENIAYGVISQLLGSLCPLGMLWFLQTLPDFNDFVRNMNWIDFFQIFAPAMLIPSLSQFRGQQHKKRPMHAGCGDDNPDVYLLNRFHVFCSSFTLWFTDISVLIFGMMYIVYGVVHFREFYLNIQIIMPIMLLVMFLAYLAVSPSAIRYNAVSAESYEVGRWIIAAVIVFSVAVSRWSVESLYVCVMSVIILCIWNALTKIVIKKTRDKRDWKKMTIWIAFLPVIAIAAVIVAVWLQLAYA